jgi:PAN domain
MYLPAGAFRIVSNFRASGDAIPGKVRTIDDCEQKCAQSSSCKVFSYNKSDGICYTSPRPDVEFVRDNKFDSGELRSAMILRFERLGGYKVSSERLDNSRSVGSVAACEKACGDAPNCRAFTYDRQSGGACDLFSNAQPSLERTDRYDSGIRITPP